jgi:hypothetical protein
MGGQVVVYGSIGIVGRRTFGICLRSLVVSM